MPPLHIFPSITLSVLSFWFQVQERKRGERDRGKERVMLAGSALLRLMALMAAAVSFQSAVAVAQRAGSWAT